jgi:membrane protein
MSGVEDMVRPIDRAQQRSRWTAFPLAVIKKFGDDSAGNLAALIAYYGFVAIFPLLLVFATVLEYVLHGDSALRQRLLTSAVADFPLIGPQLRTNGLQGHWYIIVISAVISLWGARGVANAAQTAFNTMWAVPFARRPGFLPQLGRSFALLAITGVAVLATGLLSGIGSAADALGWALRVAAFAVSLTLSAAIFLLGFRLATARDIPARDMIRSAIAAAVTWQLLLAVGTILLSHQVRHAQELYGTFGVVIGLLAWLHLQAQLTLYAVESDVVRARRLWPRSLLHPPLTEADKRAYRSYAETARRRPSDEQQIEVNFDDKRDEKPDDKSDPEPAS